MQQIKTLLGFASKAGKILTGQEQVIRSIRMGKAYLLVLANDVSDASKKKLKDKCNYYDVKLIEIFNREELSKCIGKKNKTCVVVTDKGFADSIMKKYNNMQDISIKAD